MIKKTVTYTDFDGNKTSEDLNFHISKSELVDNLHLKEEFESLQEILSGEQRALSVQEIRSVVEVVKTMMRLAYGVRSEDGKRFVKTPELWEEFTQTAAYDTLLFSMFENAEEAFKFILAILPEDLREAAAKAQAEGVTPTAASKTFGEMTDEEFAKVIEGKSPMQMSQGELMEAMKRKNAEQVAKA